MSRLAFNRDKKKKKERKKEKGVRFVNVDARPDRARGGEKKPFLTLFEKMAVSTTISYVGYTSLPISAISMSVRPWSSMLVLRKNRVSHSSQR